MAEFSESLKQGKQVLEGLPDADPRRRLQIANNLTFHRRKRSIEGLVVRMRCRDTPMSKFVNVRVLDREAGR